MSDKISLLPFRNGTRQRIADVDDPPTVAFAAGGKFSFTLPKVGYLNCLLVTFDGKMTTAAGYVPSGTAPFSLVNNFTVLGNQGSAELFNVSGYGTHLIQRTYAYGGTTVNADSSVYTLPAAGANADAPVRVHWLIPIAMNNGVEFDKGLVNLQAVESVFTAKGTFGDLTELGSNVTSVTGTLSMQYLYYEVPQPQRYSQPPVMFVRWLEESLPIHKTGKNTVPLARQGILLNLIHRVELNGSPSDAWTHWGIQFNKGDTPYNVTRANVRALERYRYGLNTPTGVIMPDFMNAFGLVNTGDARDAIDTEENAVNEVHITIDGAAVLGANNNRIITLRRFFQTATAGA